MSKLLERGATPCADRQVVSVKIVLLFDEFDTAIDFAEKPKEGKGDAKSLADSPATLLSLLDRINRIDHLIVIASTNKTNAEMTTGVYARYTRKGRLDMHVTA